MSWSSSGINWSDPDTNTPIWIVCEELAKAINERYKASNFAYNNYPLIAITEDDDNPTSTISRGNRQYKMYETAKNPYKPNNLIGSPLRIITDAIQNELTWTFGRIDITDFTTSALPGPREEYSLYGFPQLFEASNPGGMTALEWVESLVPSCNGVATKIRASDSSIFTDLGFVKKSVIKELWELMKAFKYMFFFKSSVDTQEIEILNEPVSSFPSTYASTSFGDTITDKKFPTNSVVRDGADITTFLLRNSQYIDELSDTIFTSAPDLVTSPKYQIVQTGDDDIMVECLAEGIYEANVTITGTEVKADLFTTSGGSKPASITLPADGEHFGTSLRDVSFGSGITIAQLCYDLTTSTDLEYGADGS